MISSNKDNVVNFQLFGTFLAPFLNVWIAHGDFIAHWQILPLTNKMRGNCSNLNELNRMLLKKIPDLFRFN